MAEATHSTTAPTRPPTPPAGGIIEAMTWAAEVDHRRNLIGLLASHGAYNTPRVSTSVWLLPDEAEKAGQALIEAVAAWRRAQ